LHRKSIAVELMVRGGEQLLLGWGRYECDPEQGSRLTIKCSCTSGYELELHEPSWKGKILSGQRYGCDFFLRIV